MASQFIKRYWRNLNEIVVKGRIFENKHKFNDKINKMQDEKGSENLKES